MTLRLSDLEELLDEIKYNIDSRQLFYDVRYKKYTTTFEWCEDKLQMLILWRTAPWLKQNNDFPDILQECVDVIEKADDVRVVKKFESLKEGVRNAFRDEEEDLDRAITNINAAVKYCDESDDEFDDEEECIDKYNDDAAEECSKYLEICYKLTSKFFYDLHKLYLNVLHQLAVKDLAKKEKIIVKANNAEKEKAKEKAKAKAEKEKAKAKAAAEKAKEKAKAEKAKAKAKAAAEKAKTKAVAEKEKAKAKAAAEKAKAKAVAEKAKAKAEKEQEKAKKKAAADKAKAKEKKAKDKCADARGKALEALATATAMKASKISKKFETCEAKIKK